MTQVPVQAIDLIIDKNLHYVVDLHPATGPTITQIYNNDRQYNNTRLDWQVLGLMSLGRGELAMNTATVYVTRASDGEYLFSLYFTTYADKEPTIQKFLPNNKNKNKEPV